MNLPDEHRRLEWKPGLDPGAEPVEQRLVGGAGAALGQGGEQVMGERAAAPVPSKSYSKADCLDVQAAIST